LKNFKKKPQKQFSEKAEKKSNGNDVKDESDEKDWLTLVKGIYR